MRPYTVHKKHTHVVKVIERFINAETSMQGQYREVFTQNIAIGKLQWFVTLTRTDCTSSIIQMMS
jgi:hypothetical protein